jgi:4-aminobutyrate aminotransferase
VDEIQSGFGRTGKWFAIEHFGVRPDIMTVAKGLASGLPLSGVAASKHLMEDWMPGSHGGTYGGNAVACAAAVATIRVIREEGMLENATAVGAYLMNRLRDAQETYPIIGDVRGLGLMIASEFTEDDGSPATETAKAVRKACLERHLILLTCGPWGNTIRWIPPLLVTEEQVDEAFETFLEALEEVGA